MTDNITKLSEQELSELLLKHVQGRTTSNESAAIEAAVKESPTLAEELAYYRGLSNAVKETGSGSLFDEIGWARLSKAIAAEPQTSAPESKAANDNQPFWKYAAAALAIVAALQTAFLVQSPSDTDDPVYVTASAENGSEFALNIMFQPDASAQQITERLKSVDGEIFEGPSAIGLYAIRFETEAARDRALASLQDDDAIIDRVSVR